MASISIRPYQPTDHAYIMSTMRMTLVKSPFMQGIHPAVMDTLLGPVVTLFSIAVATPTADSNTILGYIAYQGPNIVGFIFVRPGLPRRKGLAEKLIAHAGIAKGEIISPFLVTNRFDGVTFPKFAESKGYTIRHRPYLPLQLMADTVLPQDAQAESK
jgi:hypothetical protein